MLIEYKGFTVIITPEQLDDLTGCGSAFKNADDVENEVKCMLDNLIESNYEIRKNI